MTEVFNSIQVPFSQDGAIAGTPVAQTPVIEQKPIAVREAIAAAKQQPSDMVQISASQKVRKEGPIKSLKRGVANVRKFFATVAEYTKGIGKGIVSGAVAGAVVYAVTDLVHRFGKNAAKKSHSPIFAIGTAVAALGVNLWKASLNATDRRSDIHDKYIGTDKK